VSVPHGLSATSRRTALGLAITVPLLALTLAAPAAYAADPPQLKPVEQIALSSDFNSPYDLKISPDGTTAYVGYSGPTSDIDFIDLATGTVSHTVHSRGQSPAALALSPDGSQLWALNIDNAPGGVSVFDTATAALLGSADYVVGSYASSVAFSADGSKVFVAGGTDTVVTTITASDGTLDTLYFASTSDPTSVIGDPTNPAVIYVGDTTRNLVYAVNTGPVSSVEIPTGAVPRALAISGDRLYTANFGDDTVTVIDTVAKSVVATIPVDAQPGSIAVSPDGARVYTVSNVDGTLTVIDAASNTVQTTLGLGFAPAAVAVSPDSTRVYVTDSTHGQLAVFEWQSPTPPPGGDDDDDDDDNADGGDDEELADTGAASSGLETLGAAAVLLVGGALLAVSLRRSRGARGTRGAYRG